MLVTRNRKSGKHFIVIEHLPDGRLFCVNPENKIRPLSKNLFDDVFEEDKDILISDGLITNNQIQKLENYNTDRADEKKDGLRIILEEMTHWQRKALLRELQKL